MMRRLRYNVAVSLDGFIAGPSGEYDWITADQTIDFLDLFAQFDVFVMGRKTYEVLRAQGNKNPVAGNRVVVASRTMAPTALDANTMVTDNILDAVLELKHESGKDIWLFGGGTLFRGLLDAGVVDSVEVAVIPILLSQGVPLLPPGDRSPPLRLARSEVLASGIVMLAYDVSTKPSAVA